MRILNITLRCFTIMSIAVGLEATPSLGNPDETPNKCSSGAHPLVTAAKRMSEKLIELKNQLENEPLDGSQVPWVKTSWGRNSKRMLEGQVQEAIELADDILGPQNRKGEKLSDCLHRIHGTYLKLRQAERDIHSRTYFQLLRRRNSRNRRNASFSEGTRQRVRTDDEEQRLRQKDKNERGVAVAKVERRKSSPDMLGNGHLAQRFSHEHLGSNHSKHKHAKHEPLKKDNQSGECPDVSLVAEGHSMANIPIKHQGGESICASIVASDLIDAYRTSHPEKFGSDFRPTSALVLAFEHERKRNSEYLEFHKEDLKTIDANIQNLEGKIASLPKNSEEQDDLLLKLRVARAIKALPDAKNNVLKQNALIDEVLSGAKENGVCLEGEDLKKGVQVPVKRNITNYLDLLYGGSPKRSSRVDLFLSPISEQTTEAQCIYDEFNQRGLPVEAGRLYKIVESARKKGKTQFAFNVLDQIASTCQGENRAMLSALPNPVKKELSSPLALKEFAKQHFNNPHLKTQPFALSICNGVVEHGRSYKGVTDVNGKRHCRNSDTHGVTVIGITNDCKLKVRNSHGGCGVWWENCQNGVMEIPWDALGDNSVRATYLEDQN